MIEPRGLFVGRSTEFRQAVRVMVGAVIAYLAYRLLHLEQGFWAVITVVLVLQSSVGGTMGAAFDRLVGTIVGAIIGAIAAMLLPHTLIGTGVGLALVTALAAYAAAVRPQLRIAPVTAIIALLGNLPGNSPGQFAVDRIAEIALGGVIGVAISLIIFPARSRGVLAQRVGDVLEQFESLMRSAADAMENGASPPGVPQQAPLRAALGAVETAMKDAERERQSRLADHGVPRAVPRTLWRIRNDLVHVTRGLESRLPDAVGAYFHPAAARLLRHEADVAAACRQAFAEHRRVVPLDSERHYAEFADAIAQLRAAQVAKGLDFEMIGRLFGEIFALQQLHRNCTDLIARIDEAAVAPAQNRLFGRRGDQTMPSSP